MAISIVCDCNEENEDFLLVKDWIESYVYYCENDCNYVDLSNIKLKECMRERCIDREYDRGSAFECIKSKKCIRENNTNQMLLFYQKLQKMNEGLIFLLDLSTRENKRRLAMLNNNMRYNRVYRDSHRRNALLIIIENDHTYDADLLNDFCINLEYIKIEILDMFKINYRNLYYMKDVLQTAIVSLKKLERNNI